jgi:acyl-CoA synthetase (AMP-forming)/AMP-acid ligase II
MLDENGFLSVVDRLNDMLLSGRENFYATEVEPALASQTTSPKS